MALISLSSILLVYSGVNTHKQNGCHAPLSNDYSSASKCLLTCKCDIAFEWYRMPIALEFIVDKIKGLQNLGFE